LGSEETGALLKGDYRRGGMAVQVFQKRRCRAIEKEENSVNKKIKGQKKPNGKGGGILKKETYYFKIE